MKYCPMTHEECFENCAWYDEHEGECAMKIVSDFCAQALTSFRATDKEGKASAFSVFDESTLA